MERKFIGIKPLSFFCPEPKRNKKSLVYSPFFYKKDICQKCICKEAENI
jgi:hypothetical protein